MRAGFEPKGHGQPLSGDALSTYLDLCRDANVEMGWRTDSGFLFYIGGASSDTLDFNIALVRLDGALSPIPNCESIAPSGDFGKCQFELNAEWRLDYEWISQEYMNGFSEDEG